MSKHPSLKPKRQLRSKTCLGQWRASERKRRNKQRNKQRKEMVDPEVAHERYQSATSSARGITTHEYHSSQHWDFE